MDCEKWKPSNGRPKLHIAVGCRSKSVGAGLYCTGYRLYARSVRDTKAPMQLRYAACGTIQGGPKK